MKLSIREKNKVIYFTPKNLLFVVYIKKIHKNKTKIRISKNITLCKSGAVQKITSCKKVHLCKSVPLR